MPSTRQEQQGKQSHFTCAILLSEHPYIYYSLHPKYFLMTDLIKITVYVPSLVYCMILKEIFSLCFRPLSFIQHLPTVLALFHLLCFLKRK